MVRLVIPVCKISGIPGRVGTKQFVDNENENENENAGNINESNIGKNINHYSKLALGLKEIKTEAKEGTRITTHKSFRGIFSPSLWIYQGTFSVLTYHQSR